MKRGAIYAVSAELVVAGLKAVGALPAEADCVLPAGLATIHVKVSSPRLPAVGEGEPYPGRRAVAGRALGEEIC